MIKCGERRLMNLCSIAKMRKLRARVGARGAIRQADPEITALASTYLAVTNIFNEL